MATLDSMVLMFMVRLVMFALVLACSFCNRRIFLLCSLSCSANAVDVCSAAALCARASLLLFVTSSSIFCMLGVISDCVSLVGDCVSGDLCVVARGVSQAFCSDLDFFPVGIDVGFSWRSKVA